MEYTLNPPDFSPQHTVVGVFLEWNGTFLVLQRISGSSTGDVWGLPGGKVDAGESLGAAICREVLEETGISLPQRAYEQRQTLHVRHYGRDIIYHVFSAQIKEQPTVTLSPNEHGAYRFVTPREALTLPLVAATDYTIRSRYPAA